ncbi:MAG TPA: DUF72 domain-containing protein [Planctomycetota bacterium]|nr:DUF72 domain-containing protein [Planctomycetota bacterium]
MTNRRRAPRPGSPVQQGLFGPLDPDPRDAPAVAPFAVAEAIRELAAALPDRLRLGTSSWTFPGWRGIVYAEGTAQRLLARHGLDAYARHPLLSAVGIDRTFYAPIAAADFAAYAAAVPERFRFLVKAWAEVTSPTTREQQGHNPRYLDVASTTELVVAPALQGLGSRLGPLVFQFPPQGAAVTRRPEAFADALHAFFSRLPRGVHYAVELRDEALLTARYVQALAASSARHCFSVHPRMPSIARQRELVPIDGPIAVRWMLHRGLDYEQAKARYEPFDRIVDADPTNRTEIAALCDAALTLGVPVTVVVNNKAEGSAPLSVLELARQLVTHVR